MTDSKPSFDETLPPDGGATGSSPTHVLPPGSIVDHFEITRVSAENGVTIEYLAFDREHGGDVVLKEYMPLRLTRRDGSVVRALTENGAATVAAGRQVFLAEARVLARIKHPHLVHVDAVFEANGTAYQVMPYRGGTPLLRVRQEMAGPPDESALRFVLSGLLGALQALHNDGTLHGAVSPTSVLLLPDDQPLLLGPDRATAQVTNDLIESLMGAVEPSFAAPEQRQPSPTQALGAWTDLYSLAETMRFCISGEMPTPVVATTHERRESIAQLVRRLFGDAVEAPYSASLLAALDAASAPDPRVRPQSVDEFRRALQSLPPTGSQAASPGHAAPRGASPQPAPAPARPAVAAAAPTAAPIPIRAPAAAAAATASAPATAPAKPGPTVTPAATSAPTPAPAPPAAPAAAPIPIRIRIPTPEAATIATAEHDPIAARLRPPARVEPAFEARIGSIVPGHGGVHPFAPRAARAAAATAGDPPTLNVPPWQTPPTLHASTPPHVPPPPVAAPMMPNAPDPFAAYPRRAVTPPPERSRGGRGLWFGSTLVLVVCAGVLGWWWGTQPTRFGVGLPDEATSAGPPVTQPARPVEAPAEASPPLASPMPQVPPAPTATTAPPGLAPSPSPLPGEAVANRPAAPTTAAITPAPPPAATTMAPNARSPAAMPPLAAPPTAAATSPPDINPSAGAAPPATADSRRATGVAATTTQRIKPAAATVARAPTRARPAALLSPRETCGERTQFSLYRCMQTECERPAFLHHPQCERLRATDSVD